MSLFYRIAYHLGFTPWEEAATHRPAAEHVGRLFDREQTGRTPPLGRALDIGCGRGHWTIDLARRGWQVTGIDLVGKAVREARERAGQAAVDATFVEGDVTDLAACGIHPSFELFWDFGTLHGLDAAKVQAAAAEITAVAAASSVLLMLAWAPGKRGPLPRGLSRKEIAESFADWRITGEEPFDASGLPPPLRQVEPRIYRLQRALIR